jgi:xanthine dehydrogenase iron-sulfur cluster and FAD-binding subunit A
MNGWRQQYRKVGTRRAQAISKVCFAAVAKFNGTTVEEIRIALGSVAPTVMRCSHTEGAIKGTALNSETIARARAALSADIAPIDDVRSSAAYRQCVAGNLLEDFLMGLREQPCEQQLGG